MFNIKVHGKISYETQSFCQSLGVSELYANENGTIHRADGPALLFHDGREFWYIRGNRIDSYEELQKLTGYSDQHIMYLKMKYGKIL